jgi:peptidyl-prolyl cis-trans isomerase C
MTVAFLLVGAAGAGVPAPSGVQAPTSAVWVLDQIRFPLPKDAASLQQLQDDHSMDAVAAHLQKMGIVFTRGAVQINPDRLPPDLVKGIDGLPVTEPFAIPVQNMVTISVVLSRTPSATHGN